MRLPVNHALQFAALALSVTVLGGCAGGGDRPLTAPMAANGPSADYPMVLGAPYTVGSVQYTPVDRMNSDEVGYAAIGEDGAGVSAAHKTLPLPSYAEVTSLETGRTILLRIERRGPMRNDQLIELSPAAAAQLGLNSAARIPVRVRRVNPPELERGLLRSGQSAPQRMDTPAPLLAVLMRKFTPAAPAIAPAAPVRASTLPASTLPARTLPARTVPAPPRAIAAPTPPTPISNTPPVRSGSLVVQAAAFSTQSRAAAAAKAIGGQVTSAGQLFRVRVGPFPTQAEAEAALAKVRRSGYGDARIQHTD